MKKILLFLSSFFILFLWFTNTVNAINTERDVFLYKTDKWLNEVNYRHLVDNDLLNLIYDKSLEKNVDPYLVFWMIRAESTFNPKARNFCCIGLLQVSRYPVIEYNKKHWTKYTLNEMFDIRKNLEIWIEEIMEKLIKYKWNEHYALMAYNWGDSYLKRSLNWWYYSSTYSRRVVQIKEKIKSYKFEWQILEHKLLEDLVVFTEK